MRNRMKQGSIHQMAIARGLLNAKTMEKLEKRRIALLLLILAVSIYLSCLAISSNQVFPINSISQIPFLHF